MILINAILRTDISRKKTVLKSQGWALGLMQCK